MLALPLVGVGVGGSREVSANAEGPAKINASDIQWGQVSAQNTSDFSSSAHTSPLKE